MGVRNAPWLRTGDASWRNPATASRLSGLPTGTLRTLAKEGLLTTLPVRADGARHRYRIDELLALKELLAGRGEVSLALIRGLASG